MNEAERIAATREALTMLLLDGTEPTPDILSIETNRRGKGEHVVRLQSCYASILCIEKHAIRFKETTNYRDIFEEFAKKANRKIYLTHQLWRIPERKRQYFSWGEIIPDIHTTPSVQRRNPTIIFEYTPSGNEALWGTGNNIRVNTERPDVPF